MDTKNDTHSKNIRYVKYFGIIVIALLITNILQYAIVSSTSIAKKKVEMVIGNFEKESEDIFKFFTKEDYNIDNLNMIFENYDEEYQKKNYSILIYIDSCLVFWSNNNSNYPWHINPILESDNTFETNNSITYCKTFCFDTNNFAVTLLPLAYTYNVENKYLHNGFPDFFKVNGNFSANFNDMNSETSIYTSDKEPLFGIEKTNITQYSSKFNRILFVIISIYIAILISVYFNNNTKHTCKIKTLLTLLFCLIAVRLILYAPLHLMLNGNYSIINGERTLKIINLFISAIYTFFIAINIFIFLYNNYKNLSINKTNRWLIYLCITIINLINLFAVYKIIINCNINIQFFNLSNSNIVSFLTTASIILITSAAFFFSLSLSLLSSYKKTNIFIYKYPVLLIFIYSACIATIYDYAIKKRDVRITEVMSKNNIFNRNERLEKNLSDKINILSNDSVTNNIIMSNLLENGESTDLNDKIKEVFNNIIWNNYQIKYIIADSSTTMVINKDTTLYNCNDFFQNIVETDGLKVNDNIWHIDDMFNIPYYLCLIQTDVYNIWIDVVPKYNLEGIGYPELLSTDESFNFHINISEYSIALYENGVLVRNIGKFVYPLYEQESKNDKIIQTEKYHHYLYQIGEGKDIIISKPHSLANYFFFPLSVVFICLIIIILSIYPFIYTNKTTAYKTLNYKLQTYVLSFFLVSFTLIGIFSIYQLYKTNNDKNINILKEKTYSLYKDIDMIVNSIDSCSQETMKTIINDLAYTNFIDINIYDQDGYLYCTSNEEMFNNNLTSNLINPIAYSGLFNNNIWFCEESIGKYKFLSSYIIFVDKNSNIFAINIPYFIKQTELKKEISSFITSFLNIYIIMMLVSIMIVYIFTQHITLPLKKLQNSIANLNIKGDKYTKIDYQRNDEIGALVSVYNNKVDELIKNAELLAKNERELAWREMAKQVAHEIKNPLTPMKLSTQYIYRLWENNSENFNQHFEKYKNSMITEIDNLSEIATEFSNFAKTPGENKQEMNIIDFIKLIIDFYKQTSINITFTTNSDNVHINADSGSLNRVFHNIIRNAIQAYETFIDDENLVIEITCNYIESKKEIVIKIKDNGPGIPDDIKEKIFVPNFTTKNSGTGLGLAIVKNIIENADGNIKLIDSQQGAEFEITLPTI